MCEFVQNFIFYEHSYFLHKIIFQVFDSIYCMGDEYLLGFFVFLISELLADGTIKTIFWLML